jgi:predicted Zn-ribbon and HTH transcriptional regulator
MPTVRQQLMALLSQEPFGVRELSQELHVSEKEIYTHLEHIARSVTSKKKHLLMTGLRCLSCGYDFKDRKRYTPPSRCPRCKNERIQPPSFRIT